MKPPRRLRAWVTLVWLGTSASVLPHSAALAGVRNPEQDTLETARRLQPISDERWKEVAGERISQKYDIIAGDTLYGISQRLFGDARYWPKLYALNNDSITNPHLILPGRAITFMPGTGTSLPGVSLGDAGSGPGSGAGAGHAHRAKGSKAADEIELTQGRSQEWRNLPSQPWESSSIKVPDQYDALGFEKNVKIVFHRPKGFELEALSASEPLDMLGQIVGSRSDGEYLGMGDTVYIRADEELQVGETYSLTQEPHVLKSRFSDRTGYSYLLLGRVKIIGVRDNFMVGTMLSSRHFIRRGVGVIKSPKRVPELKPVAAATAVEGIVTVDKNFSTFTTAQFKQVFIDRGSEDGVQPGNVFRVYQHYDPSNDKKLTTSDFIIDADILVVQTSEKYSTGVILRSHGTFDENRSAVLLTDVSDLERNSGIRERVLGEKNGAGASEAADSELDDLDKLDAGSGMGDDEKRELEQLENWKSNPAPSANPAPPTAPEPAPINESVTPPPATSSEPLLDGLDSGLEPLKDATPPPPATDATSAAPLPELDLSTPPQPSPAASDRPAPPFADAPSIPDATPPPPPTAPALPSQTLPSDETKALDDLLGN